MRPLYLEEAQLGATSKWLGAAAAAGAVIGIPHDAEHVLKIDTRNDSATVFGSVGAGTGAALPICETFNFSEGSHFAF